MAFDVTYEAGNGWTWGISDFAAAQTDTVLVAGVAGKQIELLAWKFSTDTQQVLTLEDEDNNLVDKQYAAADGGQIARMGYADPYKLTGATVKLPANKDLTFTSSAAANVSVGVFYRLVSR